MQKIKLIQGVLCACGVICLLVTGCTTKEYQTNEYPFSLSRNSVAFPSGGGSVTVTVTTSDNWSATTQALWLELYSEGSILTVTALANTETEEIREAEVLIETLTYGTETLKVRQEPGEAATIAISYGNSNCTIDSEGGTFTFSVESNCDWNVALAESIDGWELSYDKNTGLVSITAEANTGDSITGTVLLSAGEGNLAASEKVDVKQISRAENPYYQFIGDWLVHSSDCYLNWNWIGEGTYNSCTIADYDYSIGKLSMIDWGGHPDLNLRADVIEYYGDGRAILPSGYLFGSTTISGTLYYMYLVTIVQTDGEFFFTTNNDIILTMSDDGTTVSVDGLTDDYPIIGYAAYNSYLGYVLVSNLPYCMAPVTLTKSEAAPSSSALTSPAFNAVTELPDGIQSVLPKGITERISTSTIM